MSEAVLKHFEPSDKVSLENIQKPILAPGRNYEIDALLQPLWKPWRIPLKCLKYALMEFLKTYRTDFVCKMSHSFKKGDILMAKVGIVMGSKSDMHIAEKAAAVLDECGIEYDIEVISAHRNPIKIKKWSSALEENGYGAVIAIAGLAAHLPGVVASLTVLPVIGVPGDVGPLQGKDALYSIVQMPPGIPVACIGIANGKNAGLFAVQALAAGQPELFQKLKEFRKQFGDDES